MSFIAGLWRKVSGPDGSPDLQRPAAARADIAPENRRHDPEIVRARAELDAAQAELGRLKSKLDEHATVDSLTGLPNTREFRHRLDLEFARSKRSGNPFSVLRADIDDLGSYNSDFGDVCRNVLIEDVAQQLSRSVRITDLVAVHGSGEFVILLVESNVDGAQIVAQRVSQRVSVLDVRNRRITLSIGITVMRSDVEEPNELLDEAYSALTSAKARGKGRIVIHPSVA